MSIREENEMEQKEINLIFLPLGTKTKHQIPIPFIEGNFLERVLTIIQKQEGVCELDDTEYSVLKPILGHLGISYRIVVGVPDVESPRSFLQEDDLSVVITYHSLTFHQESEKDQLIAQIERLGSGTNQSKASKEVEELDDETLF